MTNNDSMLNLSRKSRLSAEVGFLMLKGAGYAAILFFGVWIAIGLMGWFGNNFLPSESRDTRDPQSQAFRDFAERGRAPSAEAFDVVPEVTDAAADAEERLEDGAMADEAAMDEAAPVGDDEMAPATAEEADEAAMDEAAPVGDDEMAPATAEEADEATMDEAAPVGDDEMAPATAEEADEAATDEDAAEDDDVDTLDEAADDVQDV